MAVTTLRMDDELLEALRARAKQEGRSLSSMIAFLLKRAVSEGDGKPSFVGALAHRAAPEMEDFRAVRAKLNKALSPRRS